MNSRFVLICCVLLCLFPQATFAAVQVKVVPYSHDRVKLEGFLAWDDSVKGKRPGVLVVHEWWGLNDYAKDRAKQLAALGYVAMAVDMYGKGKVTSHPDTASQWAKDTTKNVSQWQARARAGLRVLQADPRVDSQRLAAIGYCFGGATVMQMVYDGAPVKGVVSFHGSLPLPPEGFRGNISTKVLVAHGSADLFISAEHITKFMNALNTAQQDWQMMTYGGAEHSFTNPSAGQYNLKGIKYHSDADRRSWGHMQQFFDEIFQ